MSKLNSVFCVLSKKKKKEKESGLIKEHFNSVRLEIRVVLLSVRLDKWHAAWGRSSSKLLEMGFFVQRKEVCVGVRPNRVLSLRCPRQATSSALCAAVSRCGLAVRR